MSLDWRVPRFRVTSLSVWRRNAKVWRRLIGPSLVINFGEPLLYLLGLGYGLGIFIGSMQDMPYLTFLASGIVSSSVMNTASFEGMFSVYTRMIPQKTYDAMMVTPLDVDDILAGEMLWCATKGLVSGSAILIVASLLGAVQGWQAVYAVPVMFLVGLSFAAPAILMTAFAPGYDFFNYYLSLVITPMFILSGVFFPISSLPELLQGFVQLLPLTHAVLLIRPLFAGEIPTQIPLHVFVVLFYALVGYYLAVVMVRRRLII